MTKNGKYFTFLFSRNSKTSVVIKRVEVPKRLLQNSLVGSLLFISFTALGVGILGVLDSSFLDETDFASAIVNPAINQVSAQVPISTNRVDYSRPEGVDEFALNSGGPFTTGDMDAEDVEIENQLRTIQATSIPANMPTIWSHEGKINNEFGFRRSPFGGRTYEFHSGLDIDGERGDIVVAAAGGTVSEAGWKGGYGQMIEIDHGNGLFTRYGHLSRIEVEAGTPVSRGQLMGFVGSTGRSTGPHLHYELRLGEKPINPRRFLPPEPTTLTKVVRQ